MDVSPDPKEVTQLLHQWKGGDKQALDQLMPFVYDQLRKLASNCLRGERPEWFSSVVILSKRSLRSEGSGRAARSVAVLRREASRFYDAIVARSDRSLQTAMLRKSKEARSWGPSDL